MKRSMLGMVLAMSCVPVLSGHADTIVLKSGDTFSGTITRVGAETVDVTTGFAGDIHVKRDTIKSLRSDAKVAIVAADGAPHSSFVGPTADGGAWQETAAMVPLPPPPPPPAVPQKVAMPDLEPYFVPVGPHWKNQFSLGIVNTTGNTESTSFASDLAFHYEDKPSEFNLKIGGVYSVTNGAQTAGQAYLDAIYRRTLPEWDKSERWYLYAENHDLYDGIKGISYRITNSVGIGYYLFKDDKFTLDVRGGPAYVYEHFFTNHKTDSDFSGLAGLRAKYVLSDRADVTEEATYTFAVEDFNRYQLTSETALNYKLPEIARGVGLKLAFRDDYDNASPAPLKRNDTRLTLSLTLDF